MLKRTSDVVFNNNKFWCYALSYINNIFDRNSFDKNPDLQLFEKYGFQ